MAVLHVHAFGPEDGPPVLVVHGVTNTGARYRRTAETALAGRRVLAPDLRGHNRSTWDPPWDAETHVRDLLDTLDAAGLEGAPVVGHSFGGLLALRLAAAAPERVERIALLDPAVAMPPERAAWEAEAARRDDSWAGPDEALAARRALRPPHSRDTADEDLAAFLGRDEDGRYRLRYSRPAVVTAWSEMARPAPSVAGYPGHVLLLSALRADYVTEPLRAALRRDLGERLAEQGIDAGHMLFWDAPEELARALRGFIGA
jgi:lipase